MSTILETSIHLTVPLARVWRVIADLEAYKSWHPFVALNGHPVAGSRITLHFRSAADGKIMSSNKAVVLHVDRLRAFTWRFVAGPFLRLEEGFAIQKAGHGTFLLHHIRFTGPFAFVFTLLFRRRLMKALEVTNRAMAAYLVKPGTASRYSPRGTR
ncbi:SRPBCC family protein [Sphingomonas oryzagri]|uniref:SRPBCC family protein n=1 Tax=Sphingomonas oryzagri TaxID=3042314 RepID=A0ABT6N593_9SPHN|nr:SRPBCC family protein [Sphingomonas oryzagri]MDH7640273.1 SRPBCC family protein [Sphingomonas oryzagri]